MNTERFELTDEEITTVTGHCGQEIPTQVEYSLISVRKVAKAQVNKILSLFEPVELEALGEEEIASIPVDFIAHPEDGQPNLRATRIRREHTISQATIKKNQKEQLYRVKEGK